MRDHLDRYYTPDDLARACVDVVQWNPRHVLGDTRVRAVLMEPSVGGGAFVRAARARWGGLVATIGVDLDPEAPGRADVGVFYPVDFLAHPDVAAGADIIVGNPPYRDAEAHIRRALAAAPVVGFLLRLSILGSVGRRALWREYPPSSVYVITPRPSFTGSGSDTSEYAWVVWGEPAHTPNREPRLRWLEWEKT